jgi:hypothetical protein
MTDGTLTADEVREVLRRAIGTRKGAAYAWAYEHGFTATFITNVLKGRQPPSTRMCEALGIRKVVRRTWIIERSYERMEAKT